MPPGRPVSSVSRVSSLLLVASLPPLNTAISGVVGAMRGHLTIPIEILDTLKDPATLRFFLWCLVQAKVIETSATIRGRELVLSPGQFIFNRRRATTELEDYGLSERKIRTALSRCIASQRVSQQTSQKITVITVTNFDSYKIIVGDTVPVNVPIIVPKREYKTSKTSSSGITKNAKNKRNTNNKEKYPLLQPCIETIFTHYRKIFPTFGRTVRPGHKDWNLIGDRVTQGYTVEECISAINGNSVDEWYKSKGLHSVRYIFRDNDLMDRFIKTWHDHHRPIISDKAKRSLQAAQSWLKMKEETHG